MDAKRLFDEIKKYLNELCALPQGFEITVELKPRYGQDYYYVSMKPVLVRGLGWVDGEGQSTTFEGALIKAWAMLMGNVEIKKKAAAELSKISPDSNMGGA